MNESHPSRKSFSDVINMTFKVYFSDFWRNIGAGALIFLASLICFIPLVLVVISMININGYPFADANPVSITAFVLAYILTIVGVSIFVPSFYTSLFGQETLFFLQQNETTPTERRTKMFSSVGRIASAQTVYYVIYFVLTVITMIPLIVGLVGYSAMDIAYGYGMEQIDNMMLTYNLVSIVLSLSAFFFVFIKQEALFQNKRWFGTFGGAFKTLFKGKFWVTFGEFFVFGLILIASFYIIFLVMLLILGVIGAAFVIPFGLMAEGESLSTAAIVVISVLGTIFVALMVAFSSFYMGLTEVFTAIVYFNARTTSEGEAFPGYESDVALEPGTES